MPRLGHDQVGEFEVAKGGGVWVANRANEDLVQSLEKTFIEAELSRAIIRTGVGSLAYCNLHCGAHGTVELEGPAIEILNMSGEIGSDEAGNPIGHITGMVMDMQGRFYAGQFISGRNPACMTVEAVLEEWILEQAVEQD